MGDPIIDKDRLIKAALILKQSFLWLNTPQGYGYWEEVMENLCDMLSIKNDDIGNIRINDWSVCGKISEAFIQSMVWSETPQGIDYWSEAAANLERMPGYQQWLRENSKKNSYKDYDRAMGVI